MARHIIQNLVGSQSKYDLAKVSESYTLNMNQETVDENQSYVNKVLRPIPGCELLVSINGLCRGMYTVSVGFDGKPKTYAVFNDTLYLIDGNNAIVIGNIPYGSSKIHFTETGNTSKDGHEFHTHLVFVDGTNCYAVDTQINPALQTEDFETIQLPMRETGNGQMVHPTHIAYAHGYIIINDENTDRCYLSYQFPFERLNGNNVDKNIFMYGSAEWSNYGQSFQSYWQPDNTLAIVSNGTRLFTFGERSYQIFQYTADLNVPFNSPDTAAGLIGLKAIDSICQIGSSIIWFGSSDIGNNGIYVMGNSTSSVERVSTPAIERDISKFEIVKDAKAQIWQSNQHVYYVIDFPSANRTFCYDMAEKVWSERCSLNNKNEKVSWRYDNATMSPEGKILHSCSDGIVIETEDKWNEHDNNPILRLRRGGVIYSDHSLFIINAIEVCTNNGQYSESFYEKPAKMLMRFTADGSNWSDIEDVSLGYAGQYDEDCVFYNFGMAKVFTIELSCSENVPFALYSIKINSDQMAY